MKQILLFIGLFLTLCSTVNAAPTTAEELRQTYAGLNRVITIAQSIFRANLKYCKNENRNFGFSYVAVNQNATSQDRALWAEALNAKVTPSVIFVLPQGAADHAGLHIGDLIVSVNGKLWTTVAAEQNSFTKYLSDQMSSQPDLQLIVRRNNEDIPILITADNSCDVDIKFVPNNGTEAYAEENMILVESGLDKLLNTDAELAFTISHELAHIILGHPTLRKEGASDKKQAAMEQAADELGIRLMMRAGYDPEAATTAIRKIDHANRGPIARTLGLFGNYMPTEQRVEFVKGVAAKVSNAE